MIIVDAGIFMILIGNPPREYTRFAKEHGWVVKYTNGGRKDFCDEKCYEEWKK